MLSSLLTAIKDKCATNRPLRAVLLFVLLYIVFTVGDRVGYRRGFDRAVRTVESGLDIAVNESNCRLAEAAE